MKLVMIAAVDRNMGIGYKNELLVKLKKDMKYFRNVTLNHTIVMGKKTYDSIGKRLPERDNIVITHSDTKIDDYRLKSMTLEEFLEQYKDSSCTVYVIGGASIYSALLPYADELLLTRIEAEYEADTYFPDIDDFVEVERHWETEKGTRFAFTKLVRIE